MDIKEKAHANFDRDLNLDLGESVGVSSSQNRKVHRRSAREEYAPERASAKIADYCQTLNLDLLG